MEQQLKARLEELRGELESGAALSRKLEQQQHSVREQMLRIAGAVQVLEEELQKVAQRADAAPPRESSPAPLTLSGAEAA